MGNLILSREVKQERAEIRNQVISEAAQNMANQTDVLSQMYAIQLQRNDKQFDKKDLSLILARLHHQDNDKALLYFQQMNVKELLSAIRLSLYTPEHTQYPLLLPSSTTESSSSSSSLFHSGTDLVVLLNRAAIPIATPIV